MYWLEKSTVFILGPKGVGDTGATGTGTTGPTGPTGPNYFYQIASGNVGYSGIVSAQGFSGNTGTFNSINSRLTNFQTTNLASVSGSTAMVGTGTVSGGVKPILDTNYSQVFYYSANSGVTGYFVYNTGAKTFVIDHPKDKNKYLVHACLEGPEAGVYYRGKSEITNDEYVEIDLPDYVCELAYNFTIQITPIYKKGRATPIFSTSEIENNKFTVYGTNGAFFWFVQGERNQIDVEPYKSDVEVKGDGPYKWI
jgi:hypothetical protein